MGSPLARAVGFLTTLGRQAVPLGGIFGSGWQPLSAIAVYWFESLLLAIVAVTLCVMIKRRLSPAALAEAQAAGDEAEARAIAAEQQAASGAGIEPRDVFLFHVGSLLVFGLFFLMVLTVVVGNGRLPASSFDWDEVSDGVTALAVVIALGFLIDLWSFRGLSVGAVQARVDECLGRWGLFWVLGFFGTGLMVFTGRAELFVGLFAGLKATREVWGALTRTFGWRPAGVPARTEQG